MDFEHFALSRDLLYLAGALTGAALGCFLSLFGKTRTIRSRNRRISVLLCVLSGAIAAMALSLIVSQMRILGAGLLFIPVGVCVFVFMLAVVFPGFVAYPLILVSGLLVIWAGHTFLRFPVIKESSVPLAFVFHEREHIVVRFPAGDRAQNNDRSPNPRPGRIESLVVSGDLFSLEFSAAVITHNRLYPIIGGEKRGAIAMIRRGADILYADPYLNNPLLLSYYSRFNSQSGTARFGIDYRTFQGQVPAILAKMNLVIFFDEQGFSFRETSRNFSF
jgi:hypothetical protein